MQLIVERVSDMAYFSFLNAKFRPRAVILDLALVLLYSALAIACEFLLKEGIYSSLEPTAVGVYREVHRQQQSFVDLNLDETGSDWTGSAWCPSESNRLMRPPVPPAWSVCYFRRC